MMAISEILTYAFTRVSSSGVVKLQPRADSFLPETYAAEPLLVLKGGVSSRVSAAELAGDVARAIGNAFVDHCAMLLRHCRSLHYKWLQTAQDSAV